MPKTLFSLAIALCFGCKTAPEPDRVGRIIIEGSDASGDRVVTNRLDLYPGSILVEVAPPPREVFPRTGMTREKIESLLGQRPQSSVVAEDGARYYRYGTLRDCTEILCDGDDRAIQVFRSGIVESPLHVIMLNESTVKVLGESTVEVAPMPRPIVPEVGMTRQRIEQILEEKPSIVRSNKPFVQNVWCVYSGFTVAYDSERRAYFILPRSRQSSVTPGNAFSGLDNNNFTSWSITHRIDIPMLSK